MFCRSQSECEMGGAPGPGVPTMRCDSSKIWSFQNRRWLTKKERLAAMGFPVYQNLAEAACCAVDVVSPNGPAYSVGNAMHVANAGSIVILAWLMAVPR